MDGQWTQGHMPRNKHDQMLVMKYTWQVNEFSLYNFLKISMYSKFS